MKASHTSDLNIDHLPITLPKNAKLASVFPKLQHQALISLGQFCDAGYNIKITSRVTYLCKDQVKTKIGTHDTKTKLWIMDIPHSPKDESIPQANLQANNIYT